MHRDLQDQLLWLAVYLLMLTRDFKTEQNSNSTLALLLSVAEYIKESVWSAVIENHKLCDLKDRKLFFPEAGQPKITVLEGLGL